MHELGLGGYMRERRKLLGLTQKGLAAAAGVSQSTISDFERGHLSLSSADARRRIAAVLRVRHIDLLLAAGQLLPEELDPALMGPPPFAEDDPRGKAVTVLRGMTNDQAEQALAVLKALGDFRRLPQD